MLKVGDKAPDFTLPDRNGNPVSLADGIQKKVWQVIYFYPADDSPGCTAEACAFRDSYEDFVEAGALVIGISGDSAESHEKFAEKHSLPFTLLSDSDGSVRRLYGVKKTLGLLPGRVTYVVEPEGVVRTVFSSQLAPKKHQQEALAAIRAGTVA
jgi:peroxiredoxin Q/BCP